MDDLLQAFGERLREARTTAGLTQQSLAERAGCHETYISRLENGGADVGLELLHRLAAALGVPIAVLAAGPAGRHRLSTAWGVEDHDVLEAVQRGFRAQVDVKGKLAELFLHRHLAQIECEGLVSDLVWTDTDGEPDFSLRVGKSRFLVECKNVRSPTAKGPKAIRVELQKTRNSKDGTNTRGYKVSDFDVIAASLFNRTGRWSFMFAASRDLATRPEEPTFLKVFHVVPTEPDEVWSHSIVHALKRTKGRK
jgi:transcriptional regulator with XRE-family HTH domain